ncbi:NAD(P)-dependent alcohol dehydrogenase [Lentzea sp. NPDC059081]|uniref:NAD(P)-dependent alcohol dehydrogenase n=1 Tax=Lentzea sp. NPDC059081 TaxID=3346719 RepID=UPI0036BC4416
MRAAVHTSFGPPEVVQVVDRPVPLLRPSDVLIKVHATTVTSAETAMRRGEPLWGRVILGLRRPRAALRTLGLEVSGVVEAVGAAVTRSLAPKPAGLTFAEAAAAVDGATTALFFLRDRAKIRPGERVLVNGASDSIGTYAVQLAKHLGASVTAVCGPSNVDLVRSLGADEVIDYTAHDFTADTSPRPA